MSVNRWLALAALVAVALVPGCHQVTDPDPDPSPMLVEESYRTDEGAFEVVLHADDALPWPPVAGASTFAIEVLGLAPRRPTSVSARTPHAPALDRTAPSPPAVTALDDTTWTTEVELPEPTVWLIPVAIRQGPSADSITLRIEVVDE